MKKKKNPSIEEAYALVLQEEQQREITPTNDNGALMVNKHTLKTQDKTTNFHDNTKPYYTR